MEILNELYKILFVGSLLYIMFIFFDLFLKIRERFIIKNETVQFKLTKIQQILLWTSLTLTISFIT